MMGFYKNLLTKNKAVVGSNPTPAQTQQPDVQGQPQMSAREKIEDKLAQLKAKQEEQKK
jgi:hypothetical protein